MVKFVKVILFLLLTVAVYSVANDSSAVKAEKQTHAVALQEAIPESLFLQAEQPCLPEAELAGGSASTHQLTMSRLQRVHVLQYSLALKALVQCMTSRKAALSQHQGRIFDTTTSYYCHPASQYYVFALRRILI